MVAIQSGHFEEYTPIYVSCILMLAAKLLWQDFLQLSSIYIAAETQGNPLFIGRQTNITYHRVTDLDWKCACVQPPRHHAA